MSGESFRKDYVWNSDAGEFISESHQRVAEIVNDFNPELSVAWIPPADRTESDREPFAIVHTPSNGIAPYIVMYVAEEDMNANVLARLWAGDLSRTNANEFLRALDAANDIIKLREELDMREKREEAHDRAKSIFHSPKHTYELGGGRKIRL